MIKLWMKYQLKLFKNVSELDSGIDNIYNSYYKVFKSTYIMLGYWPTQSTKLRVIMLTYHVTVSALLLHGQVLYLYRNRQDYDKFFGNSVWVALNTAIIWEFFEIIQSTFARAQSKEEKHLVITYAVAFHQLMIFNKLVHAVIMAVLALPYIIGIPKNIWLDSEMLITDDMIFMKTAYPPRITTLIILCGAPCYFNYLMMFHSIIISGIGHIFIKYQLIKINLERYGSGSPTTSVYESKRIISRSVQDHVQFFRGMQVITAMTRVLILVGLFLITCTITLSLYDIRINSGNTMKVLTAIPLPSMCAIIIGLICFTGQNVSDISNKFKLIIYKSKWINVPPKINQSLVTIQIKCFSPTEISAYGILTISMELYIKMLRTSFTYLTLLWTLRNPSE